jgi:hypothetical protein
LWGIAGSLGGGRVAGQAYRLAVVAIAFIGGGLGAVLVFTTDIPPWISVMLAFGVASLLSLSWLVTAVLLTELAGQSRATVTRHFAVSNQLGAVGGVLLALGSFPLVGMCCLVTAALAAGVIRGKVRRAVARSMPLSPS